MVVFDNFAGFDLVEVGKDEVTIKAGKQANRRALQFAGQALVAVFGELGLSLKTPKSLNYTTWAADGLRFIRLLPRLSHESLFANCFLTQIHKRHPELSYWTVPAAWRAWPPAAQRLLPLTSPRAALRPPLQPPENDLISTLQRSANCLAYLTETYRCVTNDPLDNMSV